MKKSAYHGVYWYPRTGRWMVRVHVRNHVSGKEHIHGGYYLDEVEAAIAADQVSRWIKGPDATLNFPAAPPQRSERLWEMLRRQGAVAGPMPTDPPK